MKRITALILTFILTLSSCINFNEPVDWVFDNSHYTGEFTDVSSVNWDDFFPGRWGIGQHWEFVYTTYYDDFYNEATMKYDLYSYENFEAARKELSYIQVKIEPKTEDYKQMYRKDSRYDSDWVHIGATTSWTQWGDTETQFIDFSHFGNKPNASEEDKTREIAAFLANISHETGEPTADQNDNYGLFYREEVGYEGRTHIGYYDNNAEYPATAGKSYHGRGPMQLSYNYNYGPASLLIYGDKTKLLNDPEQVATDGKLGFMTAIWFWMMPQTPKPSCHEVMYSDFTASSGQLSAWGFGHAVMVINGGVEGNGNIKVRRLEFYQKFARLTGVRIGINGEKCHTSGLNPY